MSYFLHDNAPISLIYLIYIRTYQLRPVGIVVTPSVQPRPCAPTPTPHFYLFPELKKARWKQI